MVARCLFLAGSLLMAWCPCASAQLPKRLEKCLPYPTLAQEIRERQTAPTQVKAHVVRYRVGSIEFLGVSDAMRQKLVESLPKPGEVLSTARLDEFFEMNKAILPSDASRIDDTSITRNAKERTVAISFDFRTCHSNSN